jgi:hypothetical protein
MNWLKTPLDWMAFGCFVADALALYVVLVLLLPVARQSNTTLIEIRTEVQAQTQALITNQIAIQALLKKEAHE